MSEAFRKFKNHIRGRFLIGLVVFAPFGLTIWVLIKLIAWGKDVLTKPTIETLRWVLSQTWPEILQKLYYPVTGKPVFWVDMSALFISILLVLGALYLIGLSSATFFGRRYILLGEKLLEQVPGARFVYNTIKQLVKILSRPKSNAFKQVVMVEFPRKGSWCLAFYTGVSQDEKTGETLANVFMPSTPNPTTGFLLMLKPEDMRLTNLTFSEASRFLFSFGVVELERLQIRPFPMPEPEAQKTEELAADSDFLPKEPA